MQELKQALQAALKDAMRAKNSERRNAIRLLQSAIKQVEIDSQTSLDDDGVLVVLRKEAKKRRETIAELDTAGRAQDAARERLELAVTEEFLPRQLSADELRPIVRKAIDEAGATSMKEMGSVMKAVMPRVQDRADGRAVSALVREMLS